MASESIIDNKLFVRLDFDHSLRANSFFQTNVANRAHLISQLLLYETVIIPTNDFGVVPTLINWFGLSDFEEAIEAAAIKFVRRKGILGYAGNGNGIREFTIFPGESRAFEWWQEAIFGESIATSIELQLKQMCPFISGKQRQKLTEKVNSLSTALTYDKSFFMKNIVHESYTDIMNNEKLLKFMMAKASKKGKPVNLTKLRGVNPNQMRVLGQEGVIKDPVDLVLRIAEINMEIVMATEAGNVDIFTSEGSEEILAGKLARYKIDKSVLESFTSLLELNNIPDIRQAVMSDDIDLSTIWSLRQKRISSQFREWLREASPQNRRDLEKAYVQVLGKSTLADSLPIRTIRFAVTTIAGLNPIVGLVAGAIDNFFVDKWLSGYSPKLLLDELSKLFQHKNAT
ncbi:MAG: hypothetical protein WA109_04830 [Bellilinea sp.]